MAAFARDEAQVDPSFVRISAAVIPRERTQPIAVALKGHSPWSHLPDTARAVSIICSFHAGYRGSVIDKSALPSAHFDRGGKCKRTSGRQSSIASDNHNSKFLGSPIILARKILRQGGPIMASMTVDTVSAYHLRKDTLLEYLRGVFPNHSHYITAEVRTAHL